MDDAWPELPLEGWRDTYETLHRYTQIPGKIALRLTPRVNHFWNCALAVTARGLVTPAIPFEGRTFAIEFDLVRHHAVVRSSDGGTRALALVPRTVADFQAELMAALASIGVHVAIDDRPSEIAEEALPFHVDRVHGAYDPAWAERFFGALSRSATVFQEFRARFVGKSSPVHFFWGSFDLALSRFSGRRAPPRPGADAITRESYSHEVVSAGWWPGDTRFPEPAYYAYAVPAPPGFAEAPVRPPMALWHGGLGEFLLPYEAVRRTPSPRRTLLDFLQSTYEAAATRLGWDRAALERDFPEAPAPTAAPPAP